MRKLHLVGVCPKRWKTTTLIDHADAYPVDAAKRDWDKGGLKMPTMSAMAQVTSAAYA